MTTEGSHPALAGRTVVVAGTDPVVVEIVRGLVGTHALLALVSADHQLVATAVEIAETAGTPVLGLTSDPADARVWERNAPHIEQRLGPIDIAIAIGPVTVREPVAATFLPDMLRRHHGVFVEVGTDVGPRDLGDGVVHCSVGTTDMEAKAIADSVIAYVARPPLPD